jgi:hypothetical protein
MTSEERFEKWAATAEAQGETTKNAMRAAWFASEMSIVRELGGEFGEFEVGPTQSLDEVREHIRNAGRVILHYVFKLNAWNRWGSERLGRTVYNDTALRKALDDKDT